MERFPDTVIGKAISDDKEEVDGHDDDDGENSSPGNPPNPKLATFPASSFDENDELLPAGIRSKDGKKSSPDVESNAVVATQTNDGIPTEIAVTAFPASSFDEN